MWQQFRRRRVIRTVLLYLALSYLAVEAALLAATWVELPSWGLRAVFGVVVLGFPLAVVLAWTYDVTPTGIVRTPDDPGAEPTPSTGPRLGWALLGAGAALGGVILRLLRG
jgi:hypothetical protein